MFSGCWSCSLALSDGASAAATLDAIASPTPKLDAPPVSNGQEGQISTQPSAGTDESDVQDLVAEIVDRVSAAGEHRMPLSNVDPFSNTQPPHCHDAAPALSPGSVPGTNLRLNID